MASFLFHLELLIIFYFLPPFLGIKETQHLSRLDGENGAKEALDAGPIGLGGEPGKTP
jgi:hypothetical protein